MNKKPTVGIFGQDKAALNKATQSLGEELNESNNWMTRQKLAVMDKYSSVIREKAIKRAKVEIALVGKEVSDYTQDQLEVIVKDQEDKIIQKYKSSSLVAVLLLVGIY